MGTYVFIDVSGKQEYIFRSKSLRDNLVNSSVIRAITEVWDNGISQTGHEETLNPARVELGPFLGSRYSEKHIVIYSGGGNSILLFEESADARSFMRSYSLAVLTAYPDLELYMSQVDENEISQLELQTDISTIQKLLHYRADRLKDKRRAMFRRWSYGIESINERGKPIPWNDRNRYKGSASDGERERMNQEQKKELDFARGMLFKRLENLLEKRSEQDHAHMDVEICTELSLYKAKAGKDRKSYIGVIAIDGNKMGEMFKRLRTAEEWGDFSKEIERIYAAAVANALWDYAASCKTSLLVTPVLMSGDDICLVVHGEDAIDVAAEILKQIQTESLHATGALRKTMNEVGESCLTACAGVAIVKVAYPFFDAVQMAERLCKQAKEALYRSADDDALSASFIDWEIVQGQVSVQKPYEKLTVRAREYNRYRIRPLRIDQDKAWDNGVYSFGAFRKLVDEIRSLLEQDKQEGKAISSSFLEKIKKQLYQGWESYQLLFDLDQTGAGKWLAERVNQIFCSGKDGYSGNRTFKQEYAALIHNNQQMKPEYHYILSDVLEALVFIASAKKEAVGTHDK